MVIACGPKVHFLKVGRADYPPKAKDFEVIVYFDDREIDREYKVVGMLFVEITADLLSTYQFSDPEVIEQLKKEARKRGADAITELRLTTEPQIMSDPETIIDVKKVKYAQAKAITFIEEIKSNKNNGN
jgi:uncharacterized protein YbjQ (UPF0145 family)